MIDEISFKSLLPLFSTIYPFWSPFFLLLFFGYSLQKFLTSWLRKFAVVAQIQKRKEKILLRILGKNIVTIFLLKKAANIDLETLDSVLSMLLQILALNHLLVSNFVLDQLQICKKAPLARWSRSTHLHYCMFPGNSFNTLCVKALQ